MLEVILDGFSQWGPLTSGSKEKTKENKTKKKKEKNPRDPVPKQMHHAPLSLCSASVGQLTNLGTPIIILSMGSNHRCMSMKGSTVAMKVIAQFLGIPEDFWECEKWLS